LVDTQIVRLDFTVTFMRNRLSAMFSILGCLALASFALACAAPATHVVPNEPSLPAPQLGRFMRESVNVPFSFVMLETATATAKRGHRVHKAASILHDAARDLVGWSNPPVVSDQGREVFFTYAQQLEDHAARLEDAAAQHEAQDTVDTVEEIRQTCNGCHHFFRPASKFSPDVSLDWDTLDLGGYQ
jgi:Cytochrome C'